LRLTNIREFATMRISEIFGKGILVWKIERYKDTINKWKM